MPKVGSGNVSGISGVFGGNVKSSPADGGEQRVDEVQTSLPPASLSRPSRVEEEPDVSDVRSSLSAPPPPPPPRPQLSKVEEQPTVRSSPPPPPPRPQPLKIVEEPIETASKFEGPAPTSTIAITPFTFPSRVKAAIAAVEARQPEPQIEQDQEQKPHDDLNRGVIMHDTQPKTDTKTNFPTHPSFDLSGFAEHEHDLEHEHEGEDLQNIYGEASAVPGMAL